jgi:phage-related protein
MTGIGQGVKEIRIHQENEYRVLYVAKFKEAVYVLHSFVKKTQQTSKKDLDIAKKRYAEMLELRRSTL